MGLYDAAHAYALAFSYRDIPAEVDALLGWATPILGRPVESVLELAAGPADHSREMAARGLTATALDIAPAMTDYAVAQAALHGQRLHAVTADMCEFALEDRFDLAITMIDSVAHIVDQARLCDHFRSVAAHLNDDGCYIIEMSHPEDSLGAQTLTQSTWSQSRNGETVNLRWGEPDDPTDTKTGVTSVTVTLDYRRQGHDPVVTREVLPQRDWSQAEVVASLGGHFVPRAWYGSFDGVALDDDAAWRMIAVLQRT